MARIRNPKDYGEKDLLGKFASQTSSSKSPLKKTKSRIRGPLDLKEARANMQANKKMEAGGFVTAKDKNLVKPEAVKISLKSEKKISKGLDETAKKPKTFGEAFKAAKGQKSFTFKGKSYARVTKEEMEKAGFKSLRAYLNAQRKKS